MDHLPPERDQFGLERFDADQLERERLVGPAPAPAEVIHRLDHEVARAANGRSHGARAPSLGLGALLDHVRHQGGRDELRHVPVEERRAHGAGVLLQRGAAGERPFDLPPVGHPPEVVAGRCRREFDRDGLRQGFTDI